MIKEWFEDGYLLNLYVYRVRGYGLLEGGLAARCLILVSSYSADRSFSLYFEVRIEGEDSCNQ